MAIARRAILYQVVTPIAAAAIQTWHSIPIALGPAPGSNRKIHLVGLDIQSTFGTVAFSSQDSAPAGEGFHVYLDAANPLLGTTIDGQTIGILGATANRSWSYTGTGTGLTINQSSPGIIAPANSINKPLMLIGSGDVTAGAIATSTLNAGGLLYAANDTGVIDGAGDGTAAYIINTVGAGGAVLTYTLTARGNGYTVANGISTSTNGAGAGFKVNVTAINKGDGALLATALYGIVQLS